jgi:UPF0755 protein
LKNILRIFVFSAALMTIFGAASSAVGFLAADIPGGVISISLCSLSSPDDLIIGAYLEAHAADLEQPAGDDDAPVTFVVQPGETASTIAGRLEQQGLVTDAELFRRYVQYNGLDSGIEAGEFILRQTMSIPEVARTLQEGQRPDQLVTIPEGLRLEQVAVKVAEQTDISSEAFLQLATTGWRQLYLDYDFLNGAGGEVTLPPTATLEGFLFPETYRLPEEAAAEDLLERMLGTFDARVTPQMQAAAAERGLSLYELITLASVVEREAVLDAERPIIAGVYQNRLEADWRLEACPTVQYGIGEAGEWWPALSLDDLNADSPYNTYRNQGLPPGPICSPGLASISATAYPAETDYFFFLVDCTKDDGSHLFSATKEEHDENYLMCGGLN